MTTKGMAKTAAAMPKRTMMDPMLFCRTSSPGFMLEMAAPVLTSSRVDGVQPTKVATRNIQRGRGVRGAATFRNHAGQRGDRRSDLPRTK